MRFLSRSARFSAKSRRAAQGHESGQDSTGFLHCGGTSGKVPINQTIHHLILIVCQHGKVPLIGKLLTLPAGHKFATLAKFVLQRWYADILELGQITCVARGGDGKGLPLPASLCQQKNPPAKRKKNADIPRNLPAPLANRPEMW